MLWFMGTVAAGGLGAMLRVLVLELCARVMLHFPLGTLTVNCLACLGAGIITALPLDNSLRLLLIGGLIGGLGTLSSICSDSINMLQLHHYRALTLYIMLTAVLGILFALTGLAAGRACAGLF